MQNVLRLFVPHFDSRRQCYTYAFRILVITPTIGYVAGYLGCFVLKAEFQNQPLLLHHIAGFAGASVLMMLAQVFAYQARRIGTWEYIGLAFLEMGLLLLSFIVHVKYPSIDVILIPGTFALVWVLGHYYAKVFAPAQSQ